MGGLAWGAPFAARLAVGCIARRHLRFLGTCRRRFGAHGGVAPPAATAVDGAVSRPVRLRARFAQLPARSRYVVLLLVPATAMEPLCDPGAALTRNKGRFGTALGQLYGWNALGCGGGRDPRRSHVHRKHRCGAHRLGGGRDRRPGSGSGLRHRPPLKMQPGEPPLPFRVPISEQGHARAGLVSRRLLAASFLCGAIVLALEVVWFRFLQLFVFASNLTFALMLAVVLLGIGLGGWLRRGGCASFHIGAEAVLALPVLSLLAGASIIVTTARSTMAWETFRASWSPPVRRLPGSRCASCCPCALSGALFTFMGAVLRTSAGEDSRAAGLLILWNAIGGAAGALAAGFVLLPRLEWSDPSSRSRSAMLVSPAGRLAPVQCSPPHHPCGLGRCGGSLLLALAVFLRNHGQALSGARGGPVGTRRQPLGQRTRGADRDHPLAVPGSLGRAGLPSFAHQRDLDVFLRSDQRALHEAVRLFAAGAAAEARDALLISYGVGMTAQALTDSPT